MKKRIFFLVLLIILLFPSVSFAKNNPFSNLDNDITVFDIEYDGDVYASDVPIGTTMIVTVKGKTYKGKIDDKYDYGTCWMTAEIPICKIGTKIKIELKKDGYTKTYYRIVKKNPDEVIKTFSDVTKDSRKIKVKVKDATPGDKVIVYMGRKRYTKKIITYAGVTVTIKLPKKKPIKWGKRFDVELYNKYGQYLNGMYDHLYYSRRIKKGYTKKQVKCSIDYVHNWGAPDSKSSASGGWSYWEYDDGSYIAFKNGRVKYWYYVY